MASLPGAPGLNDSGPAFALKAVTPSDSADLPDGTCRGIHCNVAGNVKFTGLDGVAVTVTLIAGYPIPYPATRIWSTGTTATGIFAVY